jgi:fructuronate reductase
VSTRSLTKLDRAAAAAAAGRSYAPAPVRIAHIGLGAFHRAHQAWYTDAVDDENEWGIRGFSGRSARAAEELAAQDGLFCLVQRAVDGDSVTVVDSISEAVDIAREEQLLRTIAASHTAVVTLTITEAGYPLDQGGSLELGRDDVAADVALLAESLTADRLDATRAPKTALGRLLLGLEARRRSDAGGIAIVSCDNLPSNGSRTREVLRTMAEAARGRATLDFLDDHVSFVSTSVDRITPQTTDADRAAVASLSGWVDRSPVVTEPFHSWVLCGEFPAGRPAWERAGAKFVDDIEPFEQRKLWLLNGAHSLLAYAGLARGHETVAQAVGDETIRGWIEDFWDEAERHLPAGDLDIAGYRAALLERFDNHRIRHLLSQIGQDGLTKLRVRVVPPLRAERERGRNGDACIRVLGAWVAAARSGRLPADREMSGGLGKAAIDTGRDEVSSLLARLDADLADDDGLVSAVAEASFAVRG